MAETTKQGGRRIAALLAAIALAIVPAKAVSQSVTAGGIEGVITDETGEPMIDVVVTLTGPSGPARLVETDARGQFRVGYLPVGEYELLAERLGFRPRRVIGIQVGQGRMAVVRTVLEVAGVPVDRVDTMRYVGSSSNPSPGVAVDRSAMTGLPWSTRNLRDLAARSSLNSDALEGMGLAASQTGIEVDGFAFQGARHGDLGFGRSRLAAFPLDALAQAEVMPAGADVERSSGPGGLLAATTLQGGRTIRFSGYGEAAPGALASPSEFDKPDTEPNAFGAGGAISGPIAGDTAQFLIVGGFRRESSAVAPLADPDIPGSTAVRDAVVARQGDEWADAWVPAARTTNVIHALGRVDWTVSDGQTLFGRVGFARVDGDADVAGRAGHPLVTSAEGTDLLAAAGLSSRLSDRLAMEVRLGLESSSRDYTEPTDAPLSPWTSLIAEGLVLGQDPASVGSFKRTTITLRQTTHAQFDAHQLKFGAGADLSTHEHAYAHNSLGSFVFPDLAGMIDGTGVFERRVASSAPSFPTRNVYLFAQDRWSAAPGFELLAGVRVGRPTAPYDRVAENASWLDLTGLSNTDVNDPELQVAPRLGFRWDPAGQSSFVVEGSIGRYYGELDPAVLAMLIAEGSGATIQRATGQVGSWPEPPAAPGLPTVTLLNQDFGAPYSDRGSFGLSFGFPGGVSLGVAGTIAQTRNLPRRGDLNRLPGVAGEDQDGRALFGELQQIRGIVAAVPGTNRRFRDFDRATTVFSDGEGQYFGITTSAEFGTAEGTRAFIRYTYSRTEDDWAGAAAGDPVVGIDPLPEGPGGLDWTDGRSDFDVPHRLVLGGELVFPGMPVRVAGLYRFSSGLPFTPGFRPGVDMNADGIAGNDPAFVASGGELGGLTAAWPCLSGQSGGFVERNACRAPDVHSLDLRLAVSLGELAFGRAELVVDGIDLIGADVAVRDQALYLVDPAGEVTSNPESGSTVVPLLVNPDFGRPLLPLSAGRSIRIALQVRN